MKKMRDTFALTILFCLLEVTSVCYFRMTLFVLPILSCLFFVMFVLHEVAVLENDQLDS